MKLSNLFEGRDYVKWEVRRAMQKNLVVTVHSFDVDGRSHFPDDVYIITDVPRLSDEKFNKLYNLSFEEGSLSDRVEIYPINPIDLHDVELDDAAEGITRGIGSDKWKKFVADMKEYYVPDEEDDDFDE